MRESHADDGGGDKSSSGVVTPTDPPWLLQVSECTSLGGKDGGVGLHFNRSEQEEEGGLRVQELQGLFLERRGGGLRRRSAGPGRLSAASRSGRRHTVSISLQTPEGTGHAVSTPSARDAPEASALLNTCNYLLL